MEDGNGTCVYPPNGFLTTYCVPPLTGAAGSPPVILQTKAGGSEFLNVKVNSVDVMCPPMTRIPTPCSIGTSLSFPNFYGTTPCPGWGGQPFMDTFPDACGYNGGNPITVEIIEDSANPGNYTMKVS